VSRLLYISGLEENAHLLCIDGSSDGGISGSIFALGTGVKKKMKILISAYHREPDKGSELAVGCNGVLQLAKYHDVVFTETRWHEAIERSLARNPIPRLTFIYIQLPSWALFWEKGRGTVENAWDPTSGGALTIRNDPG
jgi:hypothetical protein